MVVLALVLAGCGGGSSRPAAHGAPVAATPSPAATIPAVGNCYELTVDDVSDPLASPPPVDCASTHDAETVLVLATALNGVQQYPHPLAAGLVGEGTGPGDPVVRNLAAVCNDHLVTAYLGGDDEEAMDYVFARYAARLPSEAEWSHGARWVRCDAVYGIGAPQPAPGLLRNALHRPDEAAFRACLSGSPTGAADEVSCSSPHQAEEIGVIPDIPEDTPYPAGTAARRALAAAACGGSLANYVRGEVPAGYAADLWVGPPDAWPGPVMWCLVSRSDGGTTTTSVVPPLA